MKPCRSSHPRCATHRCSYVPPPPPNQLQPIQRQLLLHLLLTCTAIPVTIRRRRHPRHHVRRLITLHFNRLALHFQQPWRRPIIPAVRLLIIIVMATLWRRRRRRRRWLDLAARLQPSPDRHLRSSDHYCRRLGAMWPSDY